MILRVLSAFYGGMKSVSSGFYFNWGMTYARWGQPMKAMFYLNRAAKLNDKGAHIFYQRALLLIAMGRPESAIYDFNAAIAAADGSPASARPRTVSHPSATARRHGSWWEKRNSSATFAPPVRRRVSL